MLNLYNLEFKKTLKKPITLLGLILLILLMISLAFSYKPVNVSNNQTTDSPTLDMYNQYILLTKPQLKQNIDESVEILDYYNNLKERQDNIKLLDNQIKIEFDNLTVIKTTGNNNRINEQGKIIYEKMKEYCELLGKFPNMQDIDYIFTISNNHAFINNQYFISMQNWLSIIESYLNNNENDFGNKMYAILNTNNFNNVLDNCTNIAINFTNYTLNSLYDQIAYSFNAYKNHIQSTTNKTFVYQTVNKALEDLVKDVNDFNILFNQLLEFDYDIIITRQDIIDSVYSTFTNLSVIFENRFGYTRAFHQDLLAHLNKTNFIFNLNNLVDNFTVIAPDNKLIKELNAYCEKVQKNYIVNENAIYNAYQSKNSLLLSENINKQIYVSNAIVDLINNSITIACYDKYSLYEKYLDNNKIYSANCSITLSKYFIDENTYPENTIENYQFNYQVNQNVTAYDYMVYALKIATIIVIIIQALNVTLSISGERKNGNLRMLIMSPNKRSKIFNSKFFANINITIILMLVSIIIAGFVGITIFGEEVGKIITVFNADTIIVLEPIFAILINFVCQLIECIAYVSLFYLFSTTIKNFFVSSSVSILTFIACLFINKINWSILSVFPSNNFNLNKYFYSNIYSSKNILNVMFDPISYSVQNFYLSLAITLFTIILFYIINISVFKKKSY